MNCFVCWLYCRHVTGGKKEVHIADCCDEGKKQNFTLSSFKPFREASGKNSVHSEQNEAGS